MINITFHGIGGDYLSVSRQAHEELLYHLATHCDHYWTDASINIMQYVKAQQTSKAPTNPASLRRAEPRG